MDVQEAKFFCAGQRKGCTYEAMEPWTGRCPGCGRYYDVLERKKPHIDKSIMSSIELVAKTPPLEHLDTGVEAFDTITNGGHVLGMTILLGGKRGSGKSTLCLQVANGFAHKHGPAVFISGEQPTPQIGEYMARLGVGHDRLHVVGVDGGGMNAERIVDAAERVRAKLVVIDSAHTTVFDDVKGNAGSPSQVDQVANFFTEWAQLKKKSLILLSHMTQMGDFAGGTKLQHLVDALFYLDNLEEIDPTSKAIAPETLGMRRLVIDGKSRFGPTDFPYLEMSQETGIMKTPSRKRISRWENFVFLAEEED